LNLMAARMPAVPANSRTTPKASPQGGRPRGRSLTSPGPQARICR